MPPEACRDHHGGTWAQGGGDQCRTAQQWQADPFADSTWATTQIQQWLKPDRYIRDSTTRMKVMNLVIYAMLNRIALKLLLAKAAEVQRMQQKDDSRSFTIFR